LKWRAKDQQSSSEIQDLKFVSNQKDIKIKDLEREILSLKESVGSGGVNNEEGTIQMTSGLN